MTQKKFEVDLLHGPILKAMLVFAVPLFFFRRVPAALQHDGYRDYRTYAWG